MLFAGRFATTLEVGGFIALPAHRTRLRSLRLVARAMKLRSYRAAGGDRLALPRPRLSHGGWHCRYPAEHLTGPMISSRSAPASDMLKRPESMRGRSSIADVGSSEPSQDHHFRVFLVARDDEDV